LLYSSCTSSSVADCQTALVKKYCSKMIQYHGGLAEAYIKDMENRQQVEVTVFDVVTPVIQVYTFCKVVIIFISLYFQLHHLVLISAFYSHQSSHPILDKYHVSIITLCRRVCVCKHMSRTREHVFVWVSACVYDYICNLPS